MSAHSQQNGSNGITLLWVGGSSGNWDDSLNWKQMNAPAGQTSLRRVPIESDDVVFSKALSGIPAVKLYLPDSSANNLQLTLFVGRKNTAGPFCKSLRLSATSLILPDGLATATTIEVYTDQGGHITIDSASEVPHVLFSLHGGDTSITDLIIDNSSVGTLFSHANWGSISVDSLAKVRLTRSTIGGAGIFGTKASGRFYARDCVFNCSDVSFGHNSIDSLFSSTFRNDGNNPSLSFLVGRNAHFYTSQVNLESYMELHFATSGSVLNGNVKTDSPGTGIFFDQEDAAQPLANILNGNIDMAENNAIPIRGQLKISGNIVSHSSNLVYYYDSATVKVNNTPIFLIGGISNYGTNDSVNSVQHFSVEFFGEKNSNVFWPLAFPVDTLIVNKTNCAKVTLTNPLYISGEAQIKSGQLALDPNDSITYKMICRGNVNIANGGGLFLRKDGKGNVANIAVAGALSDANSQADSACSGFSNPYNGLVTFVSDANEPEFTFDFSGEYANESIVLKWNTENEFQTKNFTVEKMNGQNTFTTIAMIPAGKQTTNAYQFTDTGALSPANYYRLKINNLDGSYSYSNIVTVFAPVITMLAYPNPVNDNLFLWLPKFTGNANLAITDANGIVVRKETVNQGTNKIKMDISRLSIGVYVAVLQMHDSKQTVKFIKE